jgi:4-amino-4-deoxy-L-arabinose transferase-like glycosyltransferase
MRSSSAAAVSVAAVLTDDGNRHTNGARSRHHEDRRANVVFLTFLVLHTVVCTVLSTIAFGEGSIHHDMAEAWVWGQEFQLGYYKHPPFFAWIAGAWFHMLPRTNWSFFLLSAVNAATGLAGAWFLAGRFLSGSARWAAVLLLCLTPFYSFMAIKFNANTALLSTWPWAAYFFVRSVETRRASDGFWFGVVAGLALLTKYYSFLLVLSCAMAVLIHPERRRTLRSWAPYTAAIACCLVIAPHVCWVVNNGWPTVHYALRKAHDPMSQLLVSAFAATIGSALCLVLPTLVLFATLGRSRSEKMLRGAWRFLMRKETAWVGVLALAPFFLSLAAGFGGLTRVTTDYMIPIFYVLPMCVLAGAPAAVTAHNLRVIATVVVVLMIGSLLASPLLAYERIGSFSRGEPRREVAAEATRIWHEEYRTPLKIIAGSCHYSDSIAFYSSDSPSEFTNLDYSLAPWISPERIDREGLLIACESTDARCFNAATRFQSPRTRRFQRSIATVSTGRPGGPKDFVFLLNPPRSLR